ncbi:MAG: aldehyde ferredoxin oxidoreductase family protein [Oscillospiraceae bacterium]|nr:aldehyde ferredoxin oxidoreductase family protein [Oscillospiraceae bacterium]
MHGFVGKVLKVDLSDQSFIIEDLNEQWAKDFLGGPSLGARYLYDLMPANTPVYAPESVIGFVSGPVNDTKSFMGGRYTVVSKSPVYNGFNDSNSGGTFGPYLKRSGFDAIFVKGISEKPVYLFIDDRKVEFRDASALWGKKTVETEEALRAEIGDNNFCAALIAPAGERLSHMAAIMNDGHRAAGRGGSGAVMGSKKLKAVVCRGTHTVTVEDTQAIKDINKSWRAYADGPDGARIGPWSTHGTAANYEHCVLLSDAGIKNWGGQPADMPEEMVKPLTGEVMDAKYKVKKYACHTCNIGCGAEYHVKEGDLDYKTDRPEYETLGAFGSMLLNSDPVSVTYCNLLCNEYGFDTISMGGTIAWLMECYENGLFTLEELEGIDLKWGNAEAIMAMTKKICDYEGIGVHLHDATVKAVAHFGRGAEYLGEASGIEIPHHCGRCNPGMARTFTFDPTPGRHVKGGRGAGYGFAPPEVKYNYDDFGEPDKAGVINAEYDNLSGFCHFAFLLEPGSKFKYLDAVFGHKHTREELDVLGLRSFAMRAAFNIREGITRKDYKISPRNIGEPPIEGGPLDNVTIPLENLADQFFTAMNWHVDTGIPTKAFLEEIGGLECVLKDIYPA